MPVDPLLRKLNIDVPSQPHVLMKLSLMMAEDDLNIQAMSDLISNDMSLASAVLRAVNSSMYGLKGRVESVHQATTYLGMSEVTAITFKFGLRAAFPPVADLEVLWKRATNRGFLMSRMAQSLNIDAWAAHSAGLFEECGKAVLYRHSPYHYPAILRAAKADAELVQLERHAFGVSHEALGAALCETWGLSATAVNSVRHHITVQTQGKIPVYVGKRGACALSAVAHTLMHSAKRVDETVRRMAPQAQIDVNQMLYAAHVADMQMREAMEREKVAH